VTIAGQNYLRALERVANASDAEDAARRGWPSRLGPQPSDEEVLEHIRSITAEAQFTTAAASRKRMNTSAQESAYEKISLWIAKFELLLASLDNGYSLRTRRGRPGGASEDESRVLRSFFQTNVLPRGLKSARDGGSPIDFSVEEARDLLSKYQQLAKRLLRTVAPEIRRRQETSLTCVERLIGELRELLANFHMHAAAVKQCVTRSDEARHRTLMSTTKKSIETMLRALALHSKSTEEEDLVNFSWPSVTKVVEAELEDFWQLVPLRFVTEGGDDPRKRELTKRAYLRAAVLRRKVDLASAQLAISSLISNLNAAIALLSSFLESANEILRAQSVSQQEVEKLLSGTGALLDGPFSAPRPLLENGTITHKVAAFIMSLQSRCVLYIKRFSNMREGAGRLCAAMRSVPDGTRPARDQMQIYALRRLQHLLDGRIDPLAFSRFVENVSGIAQPRGAGTVGVDDGVDDDDDDDDDDNDRGDDDDDEFRADDDVLDGVKDDGDLEAEDDNDDDVINILDNDEGFEAKAAAREASNEDDADGSSESAGVEAGADTRKRKR